MKKKKTHRSTKRTSKKKLAVIIRSLKEFKPVLLDHYAVSYIGVFGSYVRNEQKPKSDLDILIDFSKPIGLFDFVDLKNTLSGHLGIKVDLVMRTALRPHIGQHILQEVVEV